jgi:hypothetical protein
LLVNVDPANPENAPDPQDVRAAGFGGVRLVGRPGLEDYVEACHQADLFVLSVITEQSGGHLLANADLQQILNEPDVEGTADSRTPAGYREYWRLYRETFSDVPMIAAGLGSGQPGYWRAVGALPGCSGFAVHPYGKSVEQARTLLRAYKSITPTLPLIVSEWNRPAAEVVPFAVMLRQEAVMSAWFCWRWQSWTLSSAQRRAIRAAA